LAAGLVFTSAYGALVGVVIACQVIITIKTGIATILALGSACDALVVVVAVISLATKIVGAGFTRGYTSLALVTVRVADKRVEVARIVIAAPFSVGSAIHC
jgi:hypothetical protein